MQYYEDIILNESFYAKIDYTISAEEIKGFASEWDPMPFHLDEEVAKHSPIGKLFASSVHTVAIGVKLSHSMMEKEVAVVAGLGWQDVRFPIPVCAGDTLKLKLEVIELRESQSKPDRGLMTSLYTLINQHNEVVCEYKIITMVLKKPNS